MTGVCVEQARRPTARAPLATGERWYVVQTQPRREQGAAAQLEAQGFRVFLPMSFRTIRHARKLRSVKAPSFPGYLFVALDLGRDRWRSVNGTFGVARLVMGEEAPVPAPRGVVESLVDLVDENGVARFDRDLNEGQAVRVTCGPLASAVGRLIRSEPGERVCVLLEIMGGEVRATLNRSALAAA